MAETTVLAPERPASLFGWSDDPVRVIDLSRAEGNDLLTRWGHDLGPCHRPFGQQQWGLVVNGAMVSVAFTASTVSATVEDERGTTWGRKQLGDLARICSHPDHGWATRPMLRLWRCVLVHRWEDWPVQMAVSYATPGKSGELYRHDGWTRVRVCKPASPGKGSTWSKGSATDDIGDGRKTLWVYRYGAPAEGERGTLDVSRSTPSEPSLARAGGGTASVGPEAGL